MQNDQQAIQELLRKKFAEAQIKNPSYSLRAFAQKLDIGPGALSQILSGSRRVSQKMIQKFLDKLMLAPFEKAQFYRNFYPGGNWKNGIGAIVDQEEILKLSADQFMLISEWHHYAILSLLHVKDYQHKASWIASKLGIRQAQARAAMDRLARLGLIQKKNNKIIQTKPQFKTTDDIENLSLRKAHFQTLELARRSLERHPLHLRDFTTVTMPLDIKKIPEVKALIRFFHSQLIDLCMDGNSQSDVYRLSVELFPLSVVQKAQLTKKEDLEKEQEKKQEKEARGKL